MSDPLSIAGSVAGLMTISAQIVGMAKDLFDKVKDAPETMRRVREEVESMQPIFCQVQLLLNGTGSRPHHGNLTMISVHNLMTTLTGCVIVYTRLEKMVNKVCGFNEPTTASVAWGRAGVIADRVKWGLWRHEESLYIIEDQQRQKLSLNLMLSIITCTTTTEAFEAQARLLEISTEILHSNHVHSVLLRDLISRQDEQTRVLISRQDEQARVLGEIRSYMSTLGGAGSSTVSACPPSAGSHLSDHRDNSDNASTLSKRSTLSLRLGRPDYMEDLKESRAYKRLRYFGRGIESSAESVFSLGSGCSTGNWSLLSDITLGDLSVSQIAVLNLPIDLADVSNPEPFQDRLPIETPRSPSKPRSKRSSRGRLHNAIENDNGFAVRALLALGMDIGELDSNGRTPLLHAIEKHHMAICKILVEKGASIIPGASDDDTLLTHATQMLYNLDIYNCESLDYICEALLGNRSNADIKNMGKMAGELIAVSMHDVVKGGYKSILQLLSVIESCDAEGWTPLTSAAFNTDETLCDYLVEKGCGLCLDIEQKKQLERKLSCCIHDAALGGHKTALQLLLDMGADINERDSNGETALLAAISSDDLSCVKILIERGADATISSTILDSVLHRAARKSADGEIMKYFLEHVMETRELVNATDRWGDTPLHDCSRNINSHMALGNAKMLLEAGATLTTKNTIMYTPYEVAQIFERKELAEYLWAQLSHTQQAGDPPSGW